MKPTTMNPALVLAAGLVAAASAQAINIDPVALRQSVDRLDRVRFFDTPAGVKSLLAPDETAPKYPVTYTSDFSATYDNNPAAALGGSPDDWHFDNETRIQVGLGDYGDWQPKLLGLYSGSFYDTFNAGDFNALGIGPVLDYHLTETITLRLSDMVLWAFPGDFDAKAFSRNRVNLSGTKVFNLIDDTLSVSVTPHARHDTYLDAGTDRTRVGINAEFNWQIMDRLSFVPGATWSQTWPNSGKQYSETEAYADLRYEFWRCPSGFFRSLSATLRGYFLDRNIDDTSVGINQATIAPVLMVTGKF